MSFKPLVSILVNNYNKEKYCLRAIKSTLNQSYKNIEIIFFDDCSSDNSLKYIENTYRKNLKKVKIVKNKLRGKIYSYNQLNGIHTSLKKCNGEIVCILDSDDFFKKNKVKEIVNYFKKYKQNDIVSDLPIYFYHKNNQVKSNKNYFFRTHKWSKFPPTSCISFRKKRIIEIIKKISIKKFNELWFDFRIMTYFSYKEKKFNILKKHLTYYSQDSENFDKRYKKLLNKLWWKRRYQAFQFLKYLDKKKLIKDLGNFDYMITSIVNRFFKLN